MAKSNSRVEITGGDVLKEIRESFISTEAKVALFKGLLEELNKDLDKIKTKAASIKKAMQGIDPTAIKNQQAFNNAVNESNNILNENRRINERKVKVAKVLSIEEAKLREETRKANLESRQVAKLKLAEEGSVEKLRAKLAILTREWDKLSTAERENTKRGQRLKVGLDQTREAVTKLEQSTGRHQRNVGNYASALEGLQGKFQSLTKVAGQLGIAFGGMALVRGAAQTIGQFTQSIADLRAITGASGEDLEFFKKQAIELGKTTEGGAAGVVEAYKLIGSARPELLSNAKALNEFTKNAIIFSKASGLDIPESASRLTSAMNQLKAPISQTKEFMDALANGAKLGSAEIPFQTDALLKFGAAAETSNVSIQESVALIETIAPKFKQGAEAGTGLRNILLKISAPDAWPKEAAERVGKLGINMEQLTNKTAPLSDRLKALTPILQDEAAIVKLFGQENIIAAKALLGSLDTYEQFTEGVEKSGTALEQAEIRSKTLGEAFANVGRAWDSFVLDLTNSEGAQQGMIGFLDTLSRNLPQIIAWVTKLTAAFVVYKLTTSQTSQTIAKFVSQMVKMNGNIVKVVKSMKSGDEASQKFGKALKGVGWTIAIAAATELALAMWDYYSGARAARIQQELLNEAQKKGNEELSGYLERSNKLHQEVYLRIEEQLSKGNITQEKANKLKQEAIDKETAYLKVGEEVYRQKYREISAEKDRAIAFRDSITAIEKARDAVGWEAAQQQVRELTAEQRRARTVYEGLAEKAKELGIEFREVGIETNTLKGSTEKTNASFKNQIDLLKELTEQYEEYLDAIKSTTEADYTALIAAKNEELGIEKELLLTRIKAGERSLNTDELTQIVGERKDLEIQAIEETRDYEIETLRTNSVKRFQNMREDLTKEREELLSQDNLTAAKRAEIERNYQAELEKIRILELDAEQVLDQEIIAIKSDANNEIIALERETAEEVKGINQEVADAKKEFNLQNEAQLQENLDKLAAIEAENARKRMEWAKLVSDYFIGQSEKRIEQLDKELQRNQEQSDYLKKLAAEGNITAEESLATQQKLEAEALAAKAEQERQKQRIELITTAFTTYEKHVEAGSENPLADTIEDMTLLEAFVKSLPTFYLGTPDTGRVSNPLDANGGRFAVIHDHERIIPKVLNQQIGDMSNDEVVRRIQLSRVQEASGNIAPAGWENADLIASLSGVKSEMQAVRKAIEDKPELSIEAGKIIDGTLEIVETEKRGNNTTQKIFKVRK